MSKRRMKDKDSALMNPSSPPSSDAIGSSHDKISCDQNSSNDVSYRKRGKKRKRMKDSSSHGRWTDEEHDKFVKGTLCYRLELRLSDLLPIFRRSFTLLQISFDF